MGIKLFILFGLLSLGLQYHLVKSILIHKDEEVKNNEDL